MAGKARRRHHEGVVVAVHLGTDAEGRTTATFTIPATGAAVVSVVGSFNDWTAGVHTLEPTGEGTISVTVVVAANEDLYFRYLDSDGVWFDDAEADLITEHGSVVDASRAPADPAPIPSRDPPTQPRRQQRPQS